MSILGRDTGDGENGGAVNGDTSDTNPLLENLQPDDQLHTATSVELARFPAEEHSQIAGLAGGLALELDDIADILEFCFCQTVCVLSTESAKDPATLLFTADLDEPTRGLGHGPDDDKKEYERDDLEGNRESPNEGRVDDGIE